MEAIPYSLCHNCCTVEELKEVVKSAWVTAIACDCLIQQQVSLSWLLVTPASEIYGISLAQYK